MLVDNEIFKEIKIVQTKIEQWEEDYCYTRHRHKGEERASMSERFPPKFHLTDIINLCFNYKNLVRYVI